MIREIIVTAKTIEEAVKNGAEQLGVDIEKVENEILEQPKKGILGIGAQDAKVRVYYTLGPAEAAEAFVRTVLDDMGVEGYNLTLDDEIADDIKISVSGGELGVAIGRHGDVLDALQYLANLAANRTTDKLVRVTVDLENYRSKREETLRALARRMAQKAIKSGRNVSLEPMNSYERRIIHSEIQDMEGVTTFSVGNDSDRRIVVSPEKKQRPAGENKPNHSSAKPAAPKKKVVLPEITLPPVKREPVVKAKSIDELNLADADQGETFNP
ncbi:MAG: protein jag [Ruminococcaceae bacterium]|nr:protein jag [Oscillospiraceae bacterium]